MTCEPGLSSASPGRRSHRIRHGLRDCRDCTRGKLVRQTPGGADKGRAIDPGDVGSGSVVGTYIACEYPMLDLTANLVKRAETTPTIGNTTDLLP